MRTPEHDDDDSLKALRALRWLVIVMVWGAFVFIMFPIAIYTLPDLEAAWYPPIKDQRLENEHLKPDDDSYELFDWYFVKQRRAEPEYMTFMAFAPETPQERYNVDTYIGWDCKDNLRSDRTSDPSTHVVNKKICIKLPPKLKGRTDVIIDGVFDFRVGHGFYTVPVKIPPNSVPGTAPNGTRSIPEPLASPR